MYLRRVCILYKEEYRKKCGKLIGVCVFVEKDTMSHGLFPSVQTGCAVILTTNASISKPSSQFHALRRTLQQHGLLERTNVRVSPHMKDRRKGIYVAHVEAYKEGIRRKCAHMLILEDDAFFDERAVTQSASSVTAFLASDVPWDLLYLGYRIPVTVTGQAARRLNSTARPLYWNIMDDPPRAVPGLPCIYRIRKPTFTHAYFISASGMVARSEWKYRGVHMDIALEKSDRSATYAVRPQLVFQRAPPNGPTHAWNTRGDVTANLKRQAAVQRFYANPWMVHAKEEADIYAHLEVKQPNSCAARGSGGELGGRAGGVHRKISSIQRGERSGRSPMRQPSVSPGRGRGRGRGSRVALPGPGRSPRNGRLPQAGGLAQVY